MDGWMMERWIRGICIETENLKPGQGQMHQRIGSCVPLGALTLGWPQTYSAPPNSAS